MRSKKILSFLLKVLIVGGAFAYLYFRCGLRFDSLLKSLRHPGLIAVGALCAFLPMIISFYRHWVLLRALGISCYSVGEVSRLGFIGCFFSTFMPSAFGGDVIKTAYIIHDTHENAKTVASVLIDRVQGLFGLLLMGVFAMVFACSEVLGTVSLHKMAIATFATVGVAACGAVTGVLAMLKGRRAAFLAWLAMAAVGAWGAWRLYADCGRFQFICHDPAPPADLAQVLLRGRFIVAIGGCLLAGLLGLSVIPSCRPGHRLADFISARIPCGRHLISLLDSILLFHNNLRVLFYTLFLSLLTQGINLLAVFSFGKALELETEPTLFSVFFAAPMAYIANSLPMPGGGFGVGEVVFETTMALCRTPAGAAIAGGGQIFLTWRIWYVLLSLAWGLPCYLAGRKAIDAVQREFAERNAGTETPPAAPAPAPAAIPPAAPAAVAQETPKDEDPA